MDPRVEGYDVEGQIGRGGMGVVHRAVHLRLGRVVALKVLAPEWSHDPSFRARFLEEARIAAAIEHPHVIPVFDAGETAEGLLYLAMRFVDGTDLGAIITSEGAVDARRAGALLTPIAGALDAAHSAGFVHRDVKPANVLIETVTGGSEVSYLTDFGLTKLMAASGGLTQTGQVVGTPHYMSPEQIEGRRLDARSDVYSLTCTLFHALAGRSPYQRDATPAVMYAHVHEPPPSITAVRADLGPAFDEVIRRGMAKEPRERYPSAGDLARALQHAAGSIRSVPPERSVATGEAAPRTPAPAPRTTILPEDAPGPRSSRGQSRVPLVIACVAALAAAGAAAAFALSGNDSGSPPAAGPVTQTQTTVIRETTPTDDQPHRRRPPASPLAGHYSGVVKQYAPRSTTRAAVETTIARDGATGTHTEDTGNLCSGRLTAVGGGDYIYRQPPSPNCISKTRIHFEPTDAGVRLYEVYQTRHEGSGHLEGELQRR